MRAPDSLFFLLRQTARLGLLTPLIALAQSPAFPQDAANPEAPGAPLVHPGMAPLPLGNSTPAPNAWREAHQAVAAFPRGHADILAWEQQSAASSALSPTHTPPATPGGQPHSGPGTQPMRHHMPMHGGKL